MPSNTDLMLDPGPSDGALSLMKRQAFGGVIAQRAAIVVLAVMAAVTLARRFHRIYTPQILDNLSVLETTSRLAAGQPLYRDFRKIPLASAATYGPVAPVIVASLSHAFGRGARAVLTAGR